MTELGAYVRDSHQVSILFAVWNLQDLPIFFSTAPLDWGLVVP